jgi:hypothetical protein
MSADSRFPWTRRQWLHSSCAGLAGIAVTEMLARIGAAAGSTDARSPLSPVPPHFAPRAKRIIFLFMHGGVSQVDSFDYKPLLTRDDGKPLPFDKPRVQFGATTNLLRSPWEFRQHGECGAWISDLFPEIAQLADELTFVKSLHGSNEAHGGALLKIHTGSDTFVRPSLGSWISYGLGTENENLPSFITMNPTLGHGGVQNFGAAFLPAAHQGTRIGERSNRRQPYEGQRVQATISNLTNSQISPALQRQQLAFLEQVNRQQLERTGPAAELEARIASFELAYRMQSEAPGVFDTSNETPDTLRLYGMDNPQTAAFGQQCLLARRLAEAGVRFVQCTHSYWDQHEALKEKHTENAGQVDRPIAGLLRDLKARGMFDDTLVIWGTEFGRTPVAQNSNGRDHNPHGFTWWLAGAGVKPGVSYGATDDYGYYAAENKVHIHDLHATILHLLGLDHERLTYRYAGRDFRLTDVSGRVVHEIFA